MVSLLSPGIPAYVTDMTTRMLVSSAITYTMFHLNHLEHCQGSMATLQNSQGHI